MYQKNAFMRSLLLSKFSLVGLAALLLAATVAADPVNRTDMSARLVYVERLLTESSAARKVDNSSNAEAIEMKAKAQSHFDNARELSEAGDVEAAEAELGQAIRLLTKAAKAANGDGADKVSQKQSDDYQSRRESVTALATAHDRIAKEKGLADMNRALQSKVEADLAAADALLSGGQGDEARAALDATYEAVKASLEGLRGGDTLVRELNFETKADEYAYELDRNDTHMMLIEVLLAEKMESSPMRASAEKFIGNAEELRSRAEKAADKQQFEDAIGLLEESTKELIRAIRSAGIYIPG